ncbi:type II toxin-antitoxin system RelE/ParE family toxin [Phenylobacterium aquaticum]|uniref:type II toxin-antitoxin system RelE/ParE family toxin n=1 Tax=Phenylobacterium aquaticum TaxID=1763816 RepID=UPI0026F2F6F4|nr:type II toxin-antitoxin system RelE/ParE family toxin [Phenylobacterium aquaticum]
MFRSDGAEADLTDIWVSIAKDNGPAADRVLLALMAAEDRLAAFPQLGRSRPDLPGQLRSWPVGAYLVFYRPMEGGILVIRILHGARDLGEALDEA